MNGTDEEHQRRRAVAAALAILGRRNHTAAELAAKLQRKGFDAAARAAAVTRCREMGYVDDADTARLMAESLRRRGLGAHRIRAHLREKGVAEATIQALTAPDDDPESALAAARDACARKRAAFDRETDPARRRAKIYRFLLSRGFAAEIAHRLLDEDSSSD